MSASTGTPIEGAMVAFYYGYWMPPQLGDVVRADRSGVAISSEPIKFGDEDYVWIFVVVSCENYKTQKSSVLARRGFPYASVQVALQPL